MEIDFKKQDEWYYKPQVGDYVQADYNNCLYFCYENNRIMWMCYEDGSTGDCMFHCRHHLSTFKSNFRFVGRIDKFIF